LSRILPSAKANPYSDDMRQLVRTMHTFDLEDNGVASLLRAVWALPSKRTLNRYRNRYGRYGDLRAFRATGNRRATVLRGLDLFFVAYFRAHFQRPRLLR
jgi:hypothetical protein